MSGVQLRQLGCVEGLLDVLNAYEVAPSEIEVEVTETGLLDTSAVSRENLVRMRNAGVRLALDDFGVGFSSLAHLRDLPIHRLKIDRSFTVECMRDARTLTIVKAVIEMARSLGISVTAEGSRRRRSRPGCSISDAMPRRGTSLPGRCPATTSSSFSSIAVAPVASGH